MIVGNSDTIQTLIDAALPGTKVIISAGQYEIDKPINIRKSLHIQAEGVELIVVTDGLARIFNFRSINKFSVSGCHFNNNNLGRTCININQCTNFKIFNCHFTSYKSPINVEHSNDSAIQIMSNCSVGQVSNNTFEDFGFQYGTETSTLNRAISLGDIAVENIIITNNIFRRINQGIVVAGGKHNIISNNIFDSVRDNGIYVLPNVNGLTVSGNTFMSGHDEAIVFGGKNLILTDNKFFDIPNKAFSINSSAENVIIANNLINNTTVNTGQFIVYRLNTWNIKKITIVNNIYNQTINDTNFPYVEFGNVEELVFKNNTLDVVATDYQRIIYFNGRMAINAKVSENNIRVSNNNTTAPTSIAIEVSNNTNASNIIVDNNDLSGCRFKTSQLKIYNQYIQFNVGPYGYTNKINNVFSSDVQPTSGNWTKGDISLNANPTTNGPVAWICVVSGTPGQWQPLYLN
ncbi:right-handed parallel beta-helix repeat-containing protein [Neobacillus mesonae]|nr:right-handed parallel beta-helix repeat-containing protein [Neobacillus mesonae]